MYCPVYSNKKNFKDGFPPERWGKAYSRKLMKDVVLFWLVATVRAERV